MPTVVAQNRPARAHSGLALARGSIPFQAKGYAAILQPRHHDGKARLLFPDREDGSPVPPSAVSLYTNEHAPTDGAHDRTGQKAFRRGITVQYRPRLAKDSGARHGILELEPAHGHVLISAPARSTTPEGYGTSSASVSISIIFDVCGYARAGRTGTAVQVFAKLRASGYTVGLTRVIGTLGSNAYVIWASRRRGAVPVLKCAAGFMACRPMNKEHVFFSSLRTSETWEMRCACAISVFLPTLWEKCPSNIVQGP
ncbi:hypothetical protein BGY98DRAFT_557287 [Russula aff. rugulosa BPL654]|nr:hypothetical protein BGY98DRAFT_557287 [Russula aff. rugulosa BPL654]